VIKRDIIITLFLEPVKPKKTPEDRARQRKELEMLQKQEEDMLKQLTEREQELTTTKREIQEWNRKVEVIGDLVMQYKMVKTVLDKVIG
jgi:chromosome segregation ATPase